MGLSVVYMNIFPYNWQYEYDELR